MSVHVISDELKNSNTDTEVRHYHGKTQNVFMGLRAEWQVARKPMLEAFYAVRRHLVKLTYGNPEGREHN